MDASCAISSDALPNISGLGLSFVRDHDGVRGTQAEVKLLGMCLANRGRPESRDGLTDHGAHQKPFVVWNDQRDLFACTPDSFAAFHLRMTTADLIGQVENQQLKNATVLHNSPPLILSRQPRAKACLKTVLSDVSNRRRLLTTSTFKAIWSTSSSDTGIRLACFVITLGLRSTGFAQETVRPREWSNGEFARDHLTL